MLKQILTFSLVLALFSGCSIKDKYKIATSPLDASNIMSYELSYMKRDYEKFLSEKINDMFLNLYAPSSRNILTKKVIAVTSLVNVNNFSQTSDFGRLFADLMITDLERSGWQVLDARGKTFKVLEKDGEFYLSRKDIKKLPGNTIVLVGTYSNYKKGLILNLRLIDPQYNKLLSSSNILLEDEESFFMANPNLLLDKDTHNEDTYSVKIIEDDCAKTKDCKE